MRKDLEPFLKIVKRAAKSGYQANDGRNLIRWFLEKIPTEYELVYALALSVAKWSQDYRDIEGAEKNCGLCVYDYHWNVTFDRSVVHCDRCVLQDKIVRCGVSGSNWGRWINAKTAKGKQKAVKLFRRVLWELYAKEYRKLFG